MAKKAATWLGLVLLVVGLVGFAAPGFLGAHLSVVHNLVHVASGAVALGFGVKGTREGARTFCFVFGAVYGALGVLGFALGGPGTSAAGHVSDDARLWRPIPGHLELGTTDHVIHVVVGLAFVAAALATRIVKAPLAAADALSHAP
jgi:hypothetical protein